MTLEANFTNGDAEWQDRCDEAAAREVANCNQFWGRWYMEDGMLCTWVCTPRTETLPVMKLYVYDVALEEIDDPAKQYKFYSKMQSKQWIGEKGLHDLKRAFKFILKRQPAGKLEAELVD